ncbi:Aldo/keto reductase [Xylariaceae sp. FL1651]|nr:Aldo/keto reductase [Xylariaceae sp. FL1651]
MSLAISYGKPLPDEQRLAILDQTHELGERFWDTGNFYGDAEELLGKWFAKPANGTTFSSRPRFGFRGDIAFVAEACELSLKRLSTDHIDLWYQYRLDGATPIEHIVAEMVKMKEQGKVRYLGLCEVSAETLRRAYAVHPITAVQSNPKVGLLEACRELGVAVVAYCPLSRGLLSGQIKSRDGFEEGDARQYYPRFSEENFPKNMAIVAELEKLAKAKGCTTGQLTLAWLLNQGDDIFPIPGTKTPKYLEENFAAVNVELTSNEVARIRSLVDNASSGDRYAPEHAIVLFISGSRC